VPFANQRPSLAIEGSDDFQVAIDGSAKTRDRIDRFDGIQKSSQRLGSSWRVLGVVFVFSASVLCTADVTNTSPLLVQQQLSPAGSQTISHAVGFCFCLLVLSRQPVWPAPNCQPQGFKGDGRTASAESPPECHRVETAMLSQLFDEASPRTTAPMGHEVAQFNFGERSHGLASQGS